MILYWVVSVFQACDVSEILITNVNKSYPMLSHANKCYQILVIELYAISVNDLYVMPVINLYVMPVIDSMYDM